jgi:hypothetical protein
VAVYQNDKTLGGSTLITLNNAVNGCYELWLKVYRNKDYYGGQYSKFSIDGFTYDFVPADNTHGAFWVKTKTIKITENSYTFTISDVGDVTGTYLYSAKIVQVSNIVEWEARDFDIVTLGSNWRTRTQANAPLEDAGWSAIYQGTSLGGATKIRLNAAPNGTYELWFKIYRNKDYYGGGYSHFKVDGVEYNFIPADSTAGVYWVKIKTVFISDNSYAFDISDVTDAHGTYLYSVKLQ